MAARGALAGAAAALLWAAAEPAVRRAFRTRYTDVRLLGAGLTRGPGWHVAGTAMHALNGAVFGAAFALAGQRGWRRGVLIAEVENLALWPTMAVADRLRPDVRSGAWPSLLRDPRVFAQEVAVHALFGAVLGGLLRQSVRP